jgi:predicted enzyme related to lactoylglutathione lyase
MVIMPGKIVGIGGVFLFSNNTRLLSGWYRRALGIRLRYLGEKVYYTEVYYRSLSSPDKKLHTVFAIMPAKERLGKVRNQAMINFRVDNLEGYVKRLRRLRIEVDPVFRGPDAEGTGSFTHLLDPEGNRIELWQPSRGV